MGTRQSIERREIEQYRRATDRKRTAERRNERKVKSVATGRATRASLDSH